MPILSCRCRLSGASIRRRRQINQLQISVNNLSYQVGRVLSALNRGTTPTALTIDVANQEIIAKDGTLIMSGIATVTSNYNLRIPLIWQDATGVALPPASGNTQASSSNLKVVPEVDVADDDMSIVVRVAALGSSFVTVSNGGVTPIRFPVHSAKSVRGPSRLGVSVRVGGGRGRTDATGEHCGVFALRNRAPDDGEPARARSVHRPVRQASAIADLHRVRSA